MRTSYWNRYDPSLGELRSARYSLRTSMRMPRVVVALVVRGARGGASVSAVVSARGRFSSVIGKYGRVRVRNAIDIMAWHGN
jgi:hypothetical protein